MPSSAAAQKIRFPASRPEARSSAPVATHAATAAASVFLPKEHGSWALALEPVALGLLVAPSAPGAALALGVVAGFLCRRPLKIALAPQSSVRRVAARETVVMLTSLVVASGFEVVLLGDPAQCWPLVLALPGGLLFLKFDWQADGRVAAAEIAGSAAFALLPATFATLAGWPARSALLLALLALVRSVPTVLTIRAFLRQRKEEFVTATPPLLAAGLAATAVAALGWKGIVAWPALVGATALGLRTLWLVGPWRPAWSARRTGVMEIIVGVIYLVLIATAFRFP